MVFRPALPTNLKGKLTDQQWVFCAEYLASPTLSSADAARAAGYKCPAKAGNVLMNKKHIREVIELAIEERGRQCELEKSKVLKHLCNALYLDPAEVFECTSPGVWKVKDILDISIQVRRCIKSIKHKTKHRVDSEGNDCSETWVEVSFMDKDQCMALAMKHLGLIEPDARLSINVQGDLLVRLLGEAEREAGNVVDGNVINRLSEGVQ